MAHYQNCGTGFFLFWNILQLRKERPVFTGFSFGYIFNIAGKARIHTKLILL